MRKPKPKVKIQDTFFVNVHGKKDPVILTAILKTGTLDDAKAVGRDLWKISPEPIYVRIMDQKCEERFFKKAKTI